MDSSRLTDRLRAIIPPAGPARRLLAPPAPVPSGEAGGALERALGGAWRDAGGGRCFVVERSIERSRSHGAMAVGEMAAQMEDASAAAALVAGDARAGPPFLFVDLETTGLSGGAGTLAFLVGCGWFDGSGCFATRQYVLARQAGEPALLRAALAELAGAGALVTFNGRSFDLPMLETRCLFHRLPWEAGARPHLDVLHPARRFWGARDGEPAPEARHVSLAALEDRLLGFRRAGDVAGAEAPARYFEFVRTGDARPLAGVLEHNRRDLLSLAAVTARLLRLAHRGHAEARDAQEALALGRLYARAGIETKARDALQHAIAMADSVLRRPTPQPPAPGPRLPPSSPRSMSLVEIDALRALAVAWRRARRHHESATCWRRLLEVRGCPPRLAREANEALAIHHEHRARDLAAARTFALRMLESAAVRERWSEAARRRVARIERKLGFLE